MSTRMKSLLESSRKIHIITFKTFPNRIISNPIIDKSFEVFPIFTSSTSNGEAMNEKLCKFYLSFDQESIINVNLFI